MRNQNLSNLTEQPQNAFTLSDSVQKPYTSKLLSQKKDEYLEAFRSQKIKILLQNKRLAAVKALSNIQEDKLGQGVSLQEFIAQCQEQNFTLEQISELVTSISSPSLYKQYFGVIGFRKLLTTENPPIQPAIDAGVVPRLIEFLSREDEPQLQAEAAWTLSNLSSGKTEQAQKIVENGAIPALIKLLSSPHHDVRLKALWPLGNIAGDSVTFRDAILQGGAIAHLIEILDKAISEGDKFMVRDANWTLSNLCRKQPFPSFEEIKEAIPVFAKIIMSQEDREILGNVVWNMSFFSDGGKQERIQRVIDTGVLPFIVKHMDNPDSYILLGCIKLIGDLGQGSNEQVDGLLRIPRLVEKLFSALTHRKHMMRQQAAWAISNIIGGRTSDHLEYIMKNPEYLDRLLHVGMNDISKVQKEVAIALKNALNCANREQMKILLEDKETFQFFGKLIQEEDCQEVALEAMYNILILEAERVPEGFSKSSCLSWLEENDLLTVLERLQEHSNLRILKFACRILGASDQEKEEEEE